MQKLKIYVYLIIYNFYFLVLYLVKQIQRKDSYNGGINENRFFDSDKMS